MTEYAESDEEAAAQVKEIVLARQQQPGICGKRMIVAAPGEVSVAHYYSQEGDAMRDPEIVFNAHWLPVEITQDPVGIYRRAAPGYYLRGVQDLARMWATNIRRQGFVKRGAFRSGTHAIQANAA